MKSNPILSYQSYLEQDRYDYVIRHLSSDNKLSTEVVTQLAIAELFVSSGQLKKAIAILNTLKPNISEENDSMIIGYYHHIHAFVLLHQDHVIEALESWEKALINHQPLMWRIWRDIALCRFFEPTGLNRLSDMLSLETLSDYERTFLSIQVAYYTWFFNHHSSLPATRPVKNFPYHGLNALYHMVLGLYNEEDSLDGLEKEIITEQLLKTQGILGGFFILRDFFSLYPDLRQTDRMNRWMNRHFEPIDYGIKTDQASLFSGLDDEPKMAVMSCLNCDNRCCYDGVYVTYEEEKRIRSHMEHYPEDFKGIEIDFLEEGEWEALFGGKRTKRVPHTYTRSDYPAHFTPTICIFALPDGRCSLQQSAIKHGLHPWHLKPELCWEFPLIGLFNEDALNHPHYFGQPDPHYFDESQPGYLSFLPCSKLDENGKSWKQLYRNELQYYLHKKGLKE